MCVWNVTDCQLWQLAEKRQWHRKLKIPKILHVLNRRRGEQGKRGGKEKRDQGEKERGGW